MNLADLPAALEKNKAAAAGVGAVAVVGFAIYQKRKTGGTATAGNAGTALSSGSQTAAMSGGVAYDSSASDYANAIQPQLDAIANKLDQMQSATTIPAPAAPPRATGLLPTAPGDHVWTPGTPKTLRPVTAIPRATGTSPAPARAPSPITYRVKPGENLTTIAKQFPSKSITATSIYNANRATIGPNKSLIKPGQTLVIR